MISTKKKFVFIHIYKNGGSSIRKALAPYSDDSKLDYTLDKIHTIIRRVTGWDWDFLKTFIRYPNHFSADSIVGLEGYPEEYFKFAIVRNPWDAQVSHYHYGKRQFWGPEYKIYQGLETFDEYIKWRQKVGQRTQKSFIYAGTNSLVDFVGKYENLEEDFAIICKRLNIVAELPVVNASKRSQYQEYYTAETRKIVEELFADDIQTFGYEF